jgi:hypothetical protein
VRVPLVHTASDSEAAAVERILGDAGIVYDMRLEPKLDTNGPCLLGLLFEVGEDDAIRSRELLAAEGLIG